MPNIQGDLALLSGGKMASYRAGGTYTVGSLPLWLWPEWWLQDQPGAIIAIMIGAAAGLGLCLFGSCAGGPAGAPDGLVWRRDE